MQFSYVFLREGERKGGGGGRLSKGGGNPPPTTINNDFLEGLQTEIQAGKKIS